LKPLNIENKIDKHGFMLACDTVYFNNWAKILFFSIKKHAPWAHIHFHIFDPSQQDLDWVSKQLCTYTHEFTPADYSQDHDSKVFYWSAARYMRFVEIYKDSTKAIDLDVDSIMIKALPQAVFEKDLEKSWVPTATKRDTLSLCSAMGFGLDNARYIIRDKLKHIYDTDRLTWALDQRLCDEMLAAGQLQQMDLKYTHYKFGKGYPYIWTGKGDRVGKELFVNAAKEYLHLL
jgi:hypothetical protein